mgnify:CR=1 FL=1
MSFTKHPKSLNETYFKHMLNAFRFFIRLQLLSFILVIHAIFPFLFQTTASSRIKELNDNMINRNN